MSREFEQAIDKILAANSGNNDLARQAMFEGLRVAIPAENQADMFFELGRTIGWWKKKGLTKPEKKLESTTQKDYDQYVNKVEAENKKMLFFHGLQPHLSNFWAGKELTPEAVWKGLDLDIHESGAFENPSFRVYVDYVTHREPDRLVGYDKALNGIRHSPTMSKDGPLEAVSDLVIAEQLVDAGAPNGANYVTWRLMHALFRDWEKRGMTHDHLFHELLPIFTFELESLLQGPMKLWIEYFRSAEIQASYKSLYLAILERARNVVAVKDLDGNSGPLAVEKRLVKLYTGSVIRPQNPTLAAVDLASRSKLLFQQAFRELVRNGMTADGMLDFLKIRELKNQDLVEDPHLWTWMSFVVDGHGDIKRFEKFDPEIVHIKALVKQDSKIMFDHLDKQLTDEELVTLFENAVGRDQRFRYLFAFSFVNKWKQADKSAYDKFFLLNMNIPVTDLLAMEIFPIWLKFVLANSDDKVEASLVVRTLLEEKYAKELLEKTANKRLTFDEVIERAMVFALSKHRRYRCMSELWSVKLLNEGVSLQNVKVHDFFRRLAIPFYKKYISTRMDHFGKKLEVSLPAGFS